MSTSQFKPIPNNERVDLDGFRIKEPIRWSCDDVVAWMLHVARRNSIPFEEINMQGFTACNGQALMSMNEQHFKERDEIYGALVYKEFCKNVAEAAKGTVVEDLIRTLKEPERETTSIADKTPNSFLSEAAASLNYNMGLNGSTNDMRPKSQNSINSLIASSSNMFNNVGQQNCNMSQMNFQHNLQNSASLNALNSLNNRNVLSQSNIPLINNIDNNRAYAHQQQHRILQHGEALLGCGTTSSLNNNLKSSVMGPSSSGLMQNNREDIEDRSIALSGQPGVNDGNGANNFLKKEVKPRKRSQHTKGNKLWEFIRDALKDPTTNPSIVKWEDSNQGVFRIVESEKLAKMWGDKKNNQKMTYEKLSRAMRTYYEKKILEPVPKTGLYPKKLVYKFGVGSFGWKGELMTGILKRKY
uniref:ETS domain-containing protein n=1 Tax=Rhabditophanes sp. KR3021 TaxID=114890 RepID=A0AC35U4Y1_9BILA